MPAIFVSSYLYGSFIYVTVFMKNCTKGLDRSKTRPAPAVKTRRARRAGLAEDFTVVVTAHDVHKMFFKIRVVADSHFLQQERHHNAKSLEAIDRADPKVHTRRFGEVSCLHGNLGDLEAKADGLRDHLRIENKVIGVQKERHGGKQPAAERAEPCVGVGEVAAVSHILQDREYTIRNKF